MTVLLLYEKRMYRMYYGDEMTGSDTAHQTQLAGRSTQFRHTVIVPTLNTPIPAKHNAIWCSTFQLAWQQAQQLSFGPLTISGAKDMVDRLNHARLAEMVPRDIYTRAGLVREGIVETIQREMLERFPDVDLAWLPGANTGDLLVAFAYLAMHITFPIPFPAITDIEFSTGDKIKAFGIKRKHDGQLEELRQQVQILYYRMSEDYTVANSEYIVDLCCTSTPYQIILAHLPWKATLEEMIQEVQFRLTKGKVATSTNMPEQEYCGSLGKYDTLCVPEMRWRMLHHFNELEGDVLSEARQIIDFTMNRCGIQMDSSANLTALCCARELDFARPFFLYLTVRGSATPCFAMWVANAELLQKASIEELRLIRHRDMVTEALIPFRYHLKNILQSSQRVRYSTDTLTKCSLFIKELSNNNHHDDEPDQWRQWWSEKKTQLAEDKSIITIIFETIKEDQQELRGPICNWQFHLLKELTGNDFGHDIGKWQIWWEEQECGGRDE